MSGSVGQNAEKREKTGDHYDVKDVKGTGIAIGREARVSIINNQNQINIYTPTKEPAIQTPTGARWVIPYTLDYFKEGEQILFTSRNREIDWVTGLLNGNGRIAVVRGLAGIGKTSLLMAGIIPQLRRQGETVIQLMDYVPPVGILYSALVGAALKLGLPEDERASLADLARTIQKAHSGVYVIILDQVERLFDPEIEQHERTEFLAALAELRDIFSTACFRLLVAVREENSERLIPLFEQNFPEIRHSFYDLLPLDQEQAITAIEHPLAQIHSPVRYAPKEFVQQELVPDLDKLYVHGQNQINPAELQIVCYRLFQAAFKSDRPAITPALYEEISHQKRAKAIVASHLKVILQDTFAPNSDRARAIIQEIALQGSHKWVVPNQIPSLGQSGAAEILEKMLEQRILIWRNVNSHREVRFASHAISTAAKNWFAPGIDAAPARLARVWQGWAAEDGLATQRQLQLLASDHQALNPSPIQVLLLLRAAVTRGLSPNPWLRLLQHQSNADLVRILEYPDDPAIQTFSDREDQADAKFLLGTPAEGEQHKTPVEASRFGPVALAAVDQTDFAGRATSALALLAAYPQAALNRLENALHHTGQGRTRWAEVRGVLVEADPKVEGQNKTIYSQDRFLIWWWRVRRRLIQDRNRLLGYPLGAALFAGLGLGLWRGITGGAADLPIGIHFAVNAFTGAILGGMTAFGMTLAASLQLHVKPGETEGAPMPTSPTLFIFLGAIFFGLGHLLVTSLTGLSVLAGETITLGFAAGAGLSAALYGQLRSFRQTGWIQIALRLIGVMILFGAIQWLAGTVDFTGLTFVWPGATYCSRATAIFGRSCAAIAVIIPAWENSASALDAGITGLVLTTGIAFGLRAAEKIIQKWNSMIPKQ